MIYPVKPSFILRAFYRQALWKVPTEQKKLYITFDDGPIPDITPWVLDTLKTFDAKATFFCVGDNVAKNKSIFDRINSEGHAIGNHTYNHLSGWKTNNITYFRNVLKGRKAVQSKLFRPPYGRLKGSQIKAIAKRNKVVLWDVLSGDFDAQLSKEACLTNVLFHSEEGSIIVFHDNVKAEKKMKYALPRTLEHFKDLGFSFEALPYN